MKICLIGRGGATDRPDIAALALSLQQADHEVHTVMTSPLQPTVGHGHEVASRRPQGLGPIGHFVRKAQPPELRHQIAQWGIKSAAADVGSDLLYPLSSRVADRRLGRHQRGSRIQATGLAVARQS